MCGIIGILSANEAAPQLVDALRRLEYRGYDSAGIATVQNGALDRRRAVGKLVNLSDVLVHTPLAGKIGIGHTRWATHGAPTEKNAHPHQAGRVAVVHNGIVENYQELRAFLATQGIGHETDTDTETVALLTQHHMDQGMAPVEAATATIAKLHGAYALAFIFEGEDDLMVITRKGSPLAIGHGSGEMFAGSDAIALAPFTDRITYLEDGDRAILTRSSVAIFDDEGHQVSRQEKRIDIDSTMVDKSGHKHFMSKEIAEQPTVVGGALRKYLADDLRSVALPNDMEIDFTAIDRLTIIGCGTAYYVGFVAKYWFEQLAGLPVDVDIASEFRYREPPLSPNSAAIFVSQSGETADTLAALEYAKPRVAKTIALTNVSESSIARAVDHILPIYAGVEVGVASTKAFTCQLTVMATLAIQAATQRGHMSAQDATDAIQALNELPAILSAALGLEQKIGTLAHDLSKAEDVLFLGRGALYPIALEGALKLKEISYIHAEGYASGELKHGPIALIDEKMPIIVVAPRDALFEKTISNMQEVVARGGKVVLVSDKEGIATSGTEVWHSVEMPSVFPAWAPILYAIPMQLIAYHTAVAKGTDVDQPRNLAKSVTVE